MSTLTPVGVCWCALRYACDTSACCMSSFGFAVAKYVRTVAIRGDDDALCA